MSVSCALLPPPKGGGGAHSPAAVGVGESQFRRLEKKLSTLPTLCSGESRGKGDRVIKVKSMAKCGHG